MFPSITLLIQHVIWMEKILGASITPLIPTYDLDGQNPWSFGLHLRFWPIQLGSILDSFLISCCAQIYLLNTK